MRHGDMPEKPLASGTRLLRGSPDIRADRGPAFTKIAVVSSRQAGAPFTASPPGQYPGNRGHALAQMPRSNGNNGGRQIPRIGAGRYRYRPESLVRCPSEGGQKRSVAHLVNGSYKDVLTLQILMHETLTRDTTDPLKLLFFAEPAIAAGRGKPVRVLQPIYF
ncbi:MAG: hypothetical protein AAGU11_14865 [Syntrophobacteraceae bacterium]